MKYAAEAKKMCESTKTFFDIFRPDRKMLVEKGIPLEQVYLMEDQILRWLFTFLIDEHDAIVGHKGNRITTVLIGGNDVCDIVPLGRE